jgi:2-dehydropantoate 2-reductase
MRFVIHGAGAIGGVIGARLAEHGFDVALIARGAHGAAIEQDGLRIESPTGGAVLRLPVVDHPSRMTFAPDDVVLLCVKTQDTHEAADALSAVVPRATPIVSVQNGVENERILLRRFSAVYGICVMCPATHLRSGVVQAHSSPTTGILDIGRFPRGADGTAGAIATALEASTFVSEPRDDIMRWKHTKLLMNLANAVEAVCARSEASGELAKRARVEGVACFHAAGIEFASDEENVARRGDLLQLGATGTDPRGGSSWQSLSRGAGTIEADYLNGEIVLLGRLHGVPTPVNALLQTHATQLARAGAPPGSLRAETLLAEADDAARQA